MRLQSDSSRERTLEKKKREKKRKRRKNEQWETKTFKVFQGITRKSYHRKRISPCFYSRRQEVPESRERSFELPSETDLFSSVIRTGCISSSQKDATLVSSKRGRRLSSRKITSLCVVRVDVYGERNNARAHTGRPREATTSSSPRTYLRHENCHCRSQTFLLK